MVAVLDTQRAHDLGFPDSRLRLRVVVLREGDHPIFPTIMGLLM